MNSISLYTSKKESISIRRTRLDLRILDREMHTTEKLFYFLFTIFSSNTESGHKNLVI